MRERKRKVPVEVDLVEMHDKAEPVSFGNQSPSVTVQAEQGPADGVVLSEVLVSAMPIIDV